MPQTGILRCGLAHTKLHLQELMFGEQWIVKCFGPCTRSRNATRRRVFVCPEAADLKALDTWSGLRTMLTVETICGVTGSGKVEVEIRYFQGRRMKSAHQKRHHVLVIPGGFLATGPHADPGCSVRGDA